MTKFLTFEEIKHSQKYEYIVKNKRDELIGYIFRYKQWKKWVFEPAYDEVIFDAECLRDMADFLEKLK